MTVRIVDRRNDSKNKSSVNRSRFIRRFKGQIRKAVSDAINKRGLKDLDEGEKIGIPGKDIDEPQFEHGRGGVWDAVRPGNDRFNAGDQVDRPKGGGGGGSGKGQASNEGEGLDEFVFTLTKDEFLDIFFDEMALPNLVKQQLAQIEQYKRTRRLRADGRADQRQPHAHHARRGGPAHRHRRTLCHADARVGKGTRRAARNPAR
jgi:uncharacterized sporulation protein YeaH/YhbH (DUF444 family)